jgi:hypothetical protein
VELQPDSFDAAFALAVVPFYAHGSRQEMEVLLARLTPQQHLDPKVIAAKFNWYYHQIGDAKAYVDLSDRQGTDINFSDADSTLQYAEALCALGQRDRAVALVRPLLDQLKARVAVNPDDSRVLSSLSYAQAVVGDHDGTMATLDNLLAKSRGYPLRLQFFVQANAAIVYGWIGEKDKAVDQMQPLMGIPIQATSSVYGLHEDIDFFPLLADPASRQPFKY